MKTHVLVKINDEEPQQVALSDLTLLIHGDGNLKIQILDPDVQEITPETTVAQARELTPDDWADIRMKPEFRKMFKFVWPALDTPPMFLEGMSLSMLHTVGLLCLLAHCAVNEKIPLIRFPETYLHPRNQAGLADLFIYLSGGAKNAEPTA
jgi:hypothetical protein